MRNSRVTSVRLLVVICLAPAMLASKCDSAVGDPCIPEEEYDADFAGFSAGEVGVEAKSLQCATRTCLANHFEGRVSCPAGQDEPGAPGADDRACWLPGSNERVAVAVPAQLPSRPAESTVYCSCRCDGPDSSARYCECPDGYECTQLVPNVGVGGEQLRGSSYCIKKGTEFVR